MKIIIEFPEKEHYGWDKIRKEDPHQLRFDIRKEFSDFLKKQMIEDFDIEVIDE